MKQQIQRAIDKYSSRKYVAFCVWAVLATFCIGVTVLTLRWAVLNRVENVGTLTTLSQAAPSTTCTWSGWLR